MNTDYTSSDPSCLTYHLEVHREATSPSRRTQRIEEDDVPVRSQRFPVNGALGLCVRTSKRRHSVDDIPIYCKPYYTHIMRVAGQDAHSPRLPSLSEEVASSGVSSGEGDRNDAAILPWVPAQSHIPDDVSSSDVPTAVPGPPTIDSEPIPVVSPISTPGAIQPFGQPISSPSLHASLLPVGNPLPTPAAHSLALPGRVVLERKEHKIRDQAAVVQWIKFRSSSKLLQPLHCRDVEVGDLFVHDWPEGVQVWMWEDDGWRSVSTGHPHPVLVNHRLQLSDKKEPSWVTRKTQVTYRSRKPLFDVLE